MDEALREELQSILAEAGRVALDWFRRTLPRRKADGTQVTDADQAAEACIVQRLSTRFPGESILSEEGMRIDGAPGAPVWHVDPIDGTSGFVAGLAYWGPTVCRVVDGALDVGAFHVPRLGEHWFGQQGGGAWRDGVRLEPLPDQEVDRDTILFLPTRFHRRAPIPWPGKVRALGSSAAHLVHVASGAGAATVIPRWSLWDVGCGALMIRESGRVIWDLAGSPVDPERVAQGLPLLVGAPNALRALVAAGWSATLAPPALGSGDSP